MGPNARTPSVKDVAHAAGVSTGTVSNVLNRPAAVVPATRERVEAVIAELGFIVNESARQLRAGRSKSLGYVMLDARNPYFTDLAAAMEGQAEAADLSLFLCNSTNDERRETNYLRRLMQQRVQGIMVTPVDPDNPVLVDLQQRGMPVVMVDRAPTRDTHCSVSVDNILGGELAARHLLDLGHRRLAFAGGPATLGQVRHRLQGAQQAVELHGGNSASLEILPGGGLTINAGRAAIDLIADSEISKRPTAVVCVNDLVALGMLQQCARRSIQVPHDLALIGYDDIDFAAAAVIPLTSIRQPRDKIGSHAADLVIEEATDDNHQHRRISFTPELVIRESTATR